MKVLVIIPTHSNSETLEKALESIRLQTHSDFEAEIIADGASPECISTSEKYVQLDNRFSLQIHPKSARRGEEFRHQTIQNSTSNFITYLADDDLFLPDHIEYMLKEIHEHDFVNQRPTFIDRANGVWAIAADLSIPSNRQWHQIEPMRNSVSLSGVMHTRAAYESLAQGWAPTPENVWTDLYMWKKFLERDDFKFRTTTRCTVFKFLGGANTYDSEKIEQNRMWANLLTQPNLLREWDDLVNRVHQMEAGRLLAENCELQERLAKLSEQ